MDIDLLKSTPDDQIEMLLAMTMQMDPHHHHHHPHHHHHHHHHHSSSSSSSSIPFSSHPNPNPNQPTNMLPLFDTTQILHHPPQLLSVSGGFPAESPPSTAAETGKETSMAAMREMIFRIAAMQPIYIDPESVKPPKRRNVRISKDPQSVAARHRRERISERIRILQRLVPGGTKMDTASMLDEAIHYVKFLKTQVQSLERAAVTRPPAMAAAAAGGFPVPVSGGFLQMGSRGNGSCYNSLGAHQHQQYSDA